MMPDGIGGSTGATVAELVSFGVAGGDVRRIGDWTGARVSSASGFTGE